MVITLMNSFNFAAESYFFSSNISLIYVSFCTFFSFNLKIFFTFPFFSLTNLLLSIHLSKLDVHLVVNCDVKWEEKKGWKMVILKMVVMRKVSRTRNMMIKWRCESGSNDVRFVVFSLFLFNYHSHENSIENLTQNCSKIHNLHG